MLENTTRKLPLESVRLENVGSCRIYEGALNWVISLSDLDCADHRHR